MIHLRQIAHGGHKPRLGGQRVQLHGARGVCRHAGAVGVADGQAALGTRVTLQGGFAVPAGGGLSVLRHALAKLIAPAQVALRLGVPLACGGTVEQHGIGPALRHTLAGLVRQAQHALPGGVTLGSGLFKIGKGIVEPTICLGFCAQRHPIRCHKVAAVAGQKERPAAQWADIGDRMAGHKPADRVLAMMDLHKTLPFP